MKPRSGAEAVESPLWQSEEEDDQAAQRRLAEQWYQNLGGDDWSDKLDTEERDEEEKAVEKNEEEISDSEAFPYPFLQATQETLDRRKRRLFSERHRKPFGTSKIQKRLGKSCTGKKRGTHVRNRLYWKRNVDKSDPLKEPFDYTRWKKRNGQNIEWERRGTRKVFHNLAFYTHHLNEGTISFLQLRDHCLLEPSHHLFGFECLYNDKQQRYIFKEPTSYDVKKKIEYLYDREHATWAARKARRPYDTDDPDILPTDEWPSDDTPLLKCHRPKHFPVPELTPDESSLFKKGWTLSLWERLIELEAPPVLCPRHFDYPPPEEQNLDRQLSLGPAHWIPNYQAPEQTEEQPEPWTPYSQLSARSKPELTPRSEVASSSGTRPVELKQRASFQYRRDIPAGAPTLERQGEYHDSRIRGKRARPPSPKSPRAFEQEVPWRPAPRNRSASPKKKGKKRISPTHSQSGSQHPETGFTLHPHPQLRTRVESGPKPPRDGPTARDRKERSQPVDEGRQQRSIQQSGAVESSPLNRERRGATRVPDESPREKESLATEESRARSRSRPTERTLEFVEEINRDRRQQGLPEVLNRPFSTLLLPPGSSVRSQSADNLDAPGLRISPIHIQLKEKVEEWWALLSRHEESTEQEANSARRRHELDDLAVAISRLSDSAVEEEIALTRLTLKERTERQQEKRIIGDALAALDAHTSLIAHPLEEGVQNFRIGSGDTVQTEASGYTGWSAVTCCYSFV